MFSSVYQWAVSKVVYPPSEESSLSFSSSTTTNALFSSPPSPVCVDDKYLSDDEFIVINTSDIKQTPPPTPRLLTDFNDCIINNYQDNDEKYNQENASNESPINDVPSILSPPKANFEESKENNDQNANNERIGFRVLRFTRDGLIKNETNDPIVHSPPVTDIRSLYQMAASGDRVAIAQLNYLSEKRKINKRKQEIGISQKPSLSKKNEKKQVKLTDDDNEDDYRLSAVKGGKSEPDWNKISERQAAKRALQQQRRANDKMLTKDRRAASAFKSGGGSRKGKNKIRFDDD